MKRIGKCLSFELKYIGKGTLTFLGFYFMIYVIIMALVLVENQIGNDGTNMNGSFYMAAGIFIFVFITSTYKSLFNSMMMFGNTRKSIVLSSFVSYAALSAAISVVSLLSLLLENLLTSMISGVSGLNILNVIYPGSINIAVELMWFTAFFILISAFAMLYGSLGYKFGKTFRWAFWIVLSFIFMLGANNILFALKNFFCIGSPDGILVAPVYFILAAVVFGAGTFISAVRQPQNA